MKIRGFIGEQSFEISQGHEQFLRMMAEAKVFSSTFDSLVTKGHPIMIARNEAKLNVEKFRETYGDAV